MMPMQEEILLSGDDRVIQVPVEDIPFYERFLKGYGINWPSEQKNANYIILSKSMVGVISSPSQKITLLPKYPEITLNYVIRLYNYVHGRKSSLDEHVLDINHVSSVDDLVKHFLGDVREAIAAGLPKSYVLSDEQSKYWRGHVDVRRTAINVALLHRNPIHTKVRHLVLDTPLNRLLKVALLKISKDPAFHFLAGQALDYLTSVDAPEQSGGELYRRVSFTVANIQLRELAIEAKMIIDELYVDDLQGSFGGKGFLINFDMLFEEFVRKILLEYSPQEFIYWKDMRILGSVAQDGFDIGERIFKPDILFRVREEDEDNRYFSSAEAILDVKNKANGLFKPADVYQISEYCAMLNSHKAVLVYPSFVEKGNAEISIEFPKVPVHLIHGVYVNIAAPTGRDFLKSINLFQRKIKKVLQN